MGGLGHQDNVPSPLHLGAQFSKELHYRDSERASSWMEITALAFYSLNFLGKVEQQKPKQTKNSLSHI